MTIYLPVKISKHASVLSNDPLMHSNSTRFKKRSSIPLAIRLDNITPPSFQIFNLRIHRPDVIGTTEKFINNGKG